MVTSEFLVVARTTLGDAVIASCTDTVEAKQIADSAARENGGTYAVARIHYTTGHERWAEWQAVEKIRHNRTMQMRYWL